MTAKIFYSSITGNTKRTAEYVKGILEEEGCEAVCMKSDPGMDQKGGTDIFLLFWCRRSSLDDLSRQILRKMKGERILAIGTIGGDADGIYGQRVALNVRREIEEQNHCEGVFILQGAVDLKRVEKRRELDRDDPHYLSNEKWERYLRNQGRPDSRDLKELELFLKEWINHQKGEKTEKKD